MVKKSDHNSERGVENEFEGGSDQIYMVEVSSGRTKASMNDNVEEEKNQASSKEHSTTSFDHLGSFDTNPNQDKGQAPEGEKKKKKRKKRKKKGKKAAAAAKQDTEVETPRSLSVFSNGDIYKVDDNEFEKLLKHFEKRLNSLNPKTRSKTSEEPLIKA